MKICKEVIYLKSDVMVYWFNDGEFHFVDDEFNLINVCKPDDEYTFLLQLRGLEFN